MTGKAGGRRQIVDGEVAVGDGVERVGRHALEAEIGGHRGAVEVVVQAHGGAGAERHLEASVEGDRQAVAIALEHPEPGEQVLGQRGHLSPLQVRVGRHHRLEVRLGARQQQLLQAAQRRALALDHAAQVQAQVGHHLVVAAACRVELGARRAAELGQAALDRHVDVFVVAARREGARFDLGRDPGKAVVDRRAGRRR